MLNIFWARLYAHWLRLWYTHLNFFPYEVLALMARVFPAPREVPAQVQGFAMVLDPHDLLQANLLLEGRWDDTLTAWLRYLAADAQVIFDVGAHCGYFSLIMAGAGPQGAALHAFEPAPRMQTFLARNISLNDLEGRVHVAPFAVGEETGEITFYVRDAIEWGIASRYPIFRPDRQERVPLRRLDDYCQEQQISRVDLLKMDIEGSEGAALHGMADGLRMGRYHLMLIELHPHLLGQEGLHTLLEALRSAGYALFRLEGQQAQPLPGDQAAGLILAALPEAAAQHGLRPGEAFNLPV